MPTCELCQTREANKKNTHYLTDSIIRTCLNLDGTNEREKGLYFSLDNTKLPIEFNFQRLSGTTLEEHIGRLPTDHEIENAKQIPFSADFIFCSVCEKHFTEIETEFITSILPLFRNYNLDNISSISSEKITIIRNFFYIQIFRSAICDDGFNIENNLCEKLRLIILNKSGDSTIPLAITYLQTTGGNEHYTENLVGFTDDKNPYIILMNDFIIQLYESEGKIDFLDFYGLNKEVNYKNFININEKNFIFNIFKNDDRRTFLNCLTINEFVLLKIEGYKFIFNMLWKRITGDEAPIHEVNDYLDKLVNYDLTNIMKYTEEELINSIINHLSKIFNLGA
ncbi:hypothetical protein [Elizabethkingia anophelis]|uniref:hypothetical protein n=1 Tax=Elizabethkingia anophelis TaxID=1117645 RepID=UPI003891C8C4